MSGMVFDIQKFSLHDGPGVRTTVFLKGCPLRCAWCHNPESWSGAPEISFRSDLCIGCGACVRACPNNAHRIGQSAHIMDRSACAGCGRCAWACPSGALEKIGRLTTTAEVMAEVAQDKVIYEESGGGVTLSGGEPAAQPWFALEILSQARAAGIHTALQTSGWCGRDTLEKLAAATDLFLFDLKADSALHERLTGAPFGPIRENLEFLSSANANIRIRIPLVPGVNDTPEHMRNAASLSRLGGVQALCIVPYHELGRPKFGRMGIGDPLPSGAAAPSDAQVRAWVRALEQMGAGPVVVEDPMFQCVRQICC